MAEPQCAASDLFVKHVAPNEIAQGNEYIIVTNGEVLWRKVRTAADSEEWRLVSRNRDEFPDIFINKSKVEKAWRVVARMTVMSN
jgi:phage repressor protein C with HTH and peptisase S24 domain